jgi:hypothetical protein
MEIKLNASSTVPLGTDRPRQKAPTPPPAREETSFRGSTALNQALENTPAVRTEAVERARALVASPTYPPPELINGVARLLAASIQANSK